MITLAMDSSGKSASVAIVEDEKCLCELFLNTGLTHSETLVPMIETALKLSKVKSIDVIAVTTGPGSFTGIRIAVSAAKGISVAKNTQCVSVSALETLAYNCIDTKGMHTIACLFDARCERAYYAIFKLENNTITRLSEDNCEEFSLIAPKLDKNIILLGDGAKIFADKFPDFKENVASDENLNIKAYSLALASQNKPLISAELLNPVYLQMPQAQRERLEKLNNK